MFRHPVTNTREDIIIDMSCTFPLSQPPIKCKDREKLQKHGPYYQLSYTHKSRSKTEFIRKQDLEITKKAIENYKEFMRLRDEWIEASIELAKNRKSQGGKAVKA